MAKSGENKWRNRIAWILGGLVLFIVLLPFALYIPWLQNIAKNIACDYVNKTTGLTINIDKVLIKYPLDVSLDGVVVLTEQRDTMLRAENLTATIAFKPLLDLQINVDEARLTNAYYHQVADDQSMILTTRINHCRVKGAKVDLERNQVDILDGEISGGNISLNYKPWEVEHEAPDTVTTAWKINAYHLTLNDIDYDMTMPPTIDKMQLHLDKAYLEDGKVHTGNKTVDAGLLTIDSVDCDYTYYNPKRAAEFNRVHPLPVDTFTHPASDSIPWVIKADSVSLHRGHARYTTSGTKPQNNGLDLNYIEVHDINIGLNNFYNKGSDLNFILSELSGKERSGIEIRSARGGIALNEQSIALNGFNLKTASSDINIDTQADLTLAGEPPQGSVTLTTDSKIAWSDVTTILPETRSLIKDLPHGRPISVSGTMNGTPSHMRLDNINIHMPGLAKATVTGTVNNILNTDRLSGDVDINAKTENLNPYKSKFLDKVTASQVNLPPMTMDGRVKFSPGEVSADARLSTGGGSLVGKGAFNTANENYKIDATLTNFPVSAILPTYGVGNTNAKINASGKGFDFSNPTTSLTANVDLGNITYNNNTYRNIKANLALNRGDLRGNISSRDTDLNADIDINGTIKGDRYAVDLNGRINHIDLQRLNLYDGESKGSANIFATLDLDLKHGVYNGNAHMTDVNWTHEGEQIYSDDALLTFAADNTKVNARFSDEGTNMYFNSDEGFEQVMKQLERVAEIAKEQFKNHSLDIDTLQQALPKFDMALKMGANGMIQRYLAQYDIDFRNIDIKMRNDSNIYLDGKILSLAYGETAIDTLTIKASEWNKYLKFDAHMGNRPGTWDDFAQVDIHGGAIRSTIDFLVEQRDIKGNTGYRFGANATLRESEVDVRLFPHEPIVGYRKWEINDSNYLNIDYINRRIRADLNLTGGESVISLTSLPAENDASKDDIDLRIEKVKIEEWTQLVPALKDMTGTLNADLQLDFDGRNVEGKGDFTINNFTYKGNKEGDFDMFTTFAIDPLTACTRVNADLKIDDATVAVAMGALNDTTSASPFHVDLALKRFPLTKANPFIPGNMVRLGGFINGNMAVTGSMDKPIINGFIAGDSAMIRMPRYGGQLRITDDSIPIRGNIIRLNDYKIYGLNENPVKLNGQVDLRDMDNMAIDLNLNGRNVQFIGSEQKRYSEVFGKGFIDIGGNMTMRNDYFDLRAKIALLNGSNITYVMTDDVSSLTSNVDENMVTFINPNDSTGTNQSLITAVQPSAINVMVDIDIQQGAKLAAFLSSDGNDRATIDGSGNLKYSLDFAGKDNLTGNYTISEGNVRYSPPVMSQKNFDINEGSRVTWTGDILNPQLDITAVQESKCSVSSDDQASRIVDFEVDAIVGGTLSNIDLQFDLSALNDMTVANELQAMTAVQRSQAAINLLLYNTYTGMSNSGTPNFTAQGAIFSFLQSKLNGWASNNLKGIDLTFGINQYDATVNGKTGTQTSYSYRLSKTLFNDRFKIVVGGEYSTDASGEENFSQNLINDISFEYLINESGSRYVRLFRHTGFESVLEGEVTKTGVGFVMKHKASTLKSLFKPSWWKSKGTTTDNNYSPERKKPEQQPEIIDTIPIVVTDDRPAVTVPTAIDNNN